MGSRVDATTRSPTSWSPKARSTLRSRTSSPEQYFCEVADQCNGGTKKYGGITSADDLRTNLRVHCLPESMLQGKIPTYDDFLEERRKLMAQRIKIWFETL